MSIKEIIPNTIKKLSKTFSLFIIKVNKIGSATLGRNTEGDVNSLKSSAKDISDFFIYKNPQDNKDY